MDKFNYDITTVTTISDINIDINLEYINIKYTVESPLFHCGYNTKYLHTSDPSPELIRIKDIISSISSHAKINDSEIQHSGYTFNGYTYTNMLGESDRRITVCSKFYDAIMQTPEYIQMKDERDYIVSVINKKHYRHIPSKTLIETIIDKELTDKQYESIKELVIN